MTGQTHSIYLTDKYVYIIKEALKSIEKEEYKLKKPNDVIKFGLKLVKRYFSIQEPNTPKELRALWEWM